MLQCVVRELREEGGADVDPAALEKAAVVLFHNEAYDCEVHVYLCAWAGGELRETDEMGPMAWYDRESLPLERMMAADREWLPPVLRGRRIRGEVWYGPGQEAVVRSLYEEVGPQEL